MAMIAAKIDKGGSTMTPEGKYLSEVIRPIAEKMRNLDYEIQAALVEWGKVRVKNDVTKYNDGRIDQGIPAVTGAEITNVVTQMQAYKALMEKVGVRDVIAKPTVQALRIG